MSRHALKTWPQYYEAISKGIKTFEARKNDRDFKVGDVLELNEWDPKTEEITGRVLFRKVSYILYGPAFGVEEGHCIMSLITVDAQ